MNHQAFFVNLPSCLMGATTVQQNWHQTVDSQEAVPSLTPPSPPQDLRYLPCFIPVSFRQLATSHSTSIWVRETTLVILVVADLHCLNVIIMVPYSSFLGDHMLTRQWVSISVWLSITTWCFVGLETAVISFRQTLKKYMKPRKLHVPLMWHRFQGLTFVAFLHFLLYYVLSHVQFK